MSTISIASSAVLVRLSIGVWQARKKDKQVSSEVDADKNTRVKAGNYHKHLLPDTAELEAIQSHANAARAWVATFTTPWDDAGYRLLPTALLLQNAAEFDDRSAEFYRKVDGLLTVYDQKIQAAQFNLGDLFRREDYPSVEEVRAKFYFVREIVPVPQTGHFCVDIGHEAERALLADFQRESDNKIAAAMRANWDRMHNILSVLSRQLGSYDNKDGKKAGGVYATVLDNALELCKMLEHLNITNDPELEQMRKDLQMTLQGVEVKELRKEAQVRDGVKAEIDALLSKFNF